MWPRGQALDCGSRGEILYVGSSPTVTPYLAEYGSILVICNFMEEIPRKVIKKTEVKTF